MAFKEVWIGSVGPFLYEDTDTYEDGEDLRGIRVDQMLMDNAPFSDNEVLRKADIYTDITNHSTQHENGGSDEMGVGGLSGLLADDQHVLDAEVLAVAAKKGANSDITSTYALHSIHGVLNVTGALTAASYADNTPGFVGDALSEIMLIETVGGEIDHSTLPDFARKQVVVDGKVEEKRDLGAMVSMLVVAIQQLNSK